MTLPSGPPSRSRPGTVERSGAACPRRVSPCCVADDGDVGSEYATSGGRHLLPTALVGTPVRGPGHRGAPYLRCSSPAPYSGSVVRTKRLSNARSPMAGGDAAPSDARISGTVLL